jgi:hypothetical protein
MNLASALLGAAQVRPGRPLDAPTGRMLIPIRVIAVIVKAEPTLANRELLNTWCLLYLLWLITDGNLDLSYRTGFVVLHWTSGQYGPGVCCRATEHPMTHGDPLGR